MECQNVEIVHSILWNIFIVQYQCFIASRFQKQGIFNREPYIQKVPRAQVSTNLRAVIVSHNHHPRMWSKAPQTRHLSKNSLGPNYAKTNTLEKQTHPSLISSKNSRIAKTQDTLIFYSTLLYTLHFIIAFCSVTQYSHEMIPSAAYMRHVVAHRDLFHTITVPYNERVLWYERPTFLLRR